jgi:hypothetical protein
MAIPSGTKLGSYEITGAIGMGGMGKDSLSWSGHLAGRNEV